MFASRQRSGWRSGGVAAVVAVMAAIALSGEAAAQHETAAGWGGGSPPVTANVLAQPRVVTGSDGNRHLVYELMLRNTSPVSFDVSEVKVAASTGQPELADFSPVRLLIDPPPAPRRSLLRAGELGFFFIHVAMPPAAAVPDRLLHRITLTPEVGRGPWTITGGETAVVNAAPIVFGPPLRGKRYIAGDGCCDAPRHVQAVMPDGQSAWWNAQRFAIDWEQLDEQNRLWVPQVGRETAPHVEDFHIYGQELLAVADGTVVGVSERVLPDQPPGKLPDDLPIEEADGNHVILDVGNGVYVLYAHMAPNSIAVTLNQRVKKGELLGRVGNSGNSSAPHLHLQAMDRPSSLAANGLPYVFERFRITGFDPGGSDDFQAAEDKGTPATIVPVDPPGEHASQLPLNVVVVDWMN